MFKESSTFRFIYNDIFMSFQTHNTTPKCVGTKGSASRQTKRYLLVINIAKKVKTLKMMIESF